MYDDPIVDGIGKVRERLAEERDFHAGSLSKELRERQGRWGKRLVRRERRKASRGATRAGLGRRQDGDAEKRPDPAVSPCRFYAVSSPDKRNTFEYISLLIQK